MTAARANDYTPGGLKLEGAYENDRNADCRDCFKQVIREVFGVQDVIIAHHLTYVREETREQNGLPFKYQVVEEIPSADALIFDHDIARELWGDQWQAILTRLALEPVDTRDELFSSLYYGRPAHEGSNRSTV